MMMITQLEVECQRKIVMVMKCQISWDHAGRMAGAWDILPQKLPFSILHLSLMECQVRWDHAGWFWAPRCLAGTFYGQFGVNTAQPD